MGNATRRVWPRAAVLASAALTSLVLSAAVAEAGAPEVEAAEIAALEQGLPRDRLLVAPIPGFTTAWHPAPRLLTVPRGTRLTFLRLAHPRVSVAWHGAVEIRREPRWSLAQVVLEGPDPQEVRVDYVLPNGQTLSETALLEVAEVDPGPARVTGVSVSSARSRRTGRGSLAGPRPMGEGHYRVPVGSRFRLAAETGSPSFAPLVEWRVDGRPQLALGPELALAATRPGVQRVSAGPPGAAVTVELEVYSVRIVPPPDLEGRIARGEPLTFRAVTEPPGLEDGVRWEARAGGRQPVPAFGSGGSFSFDLLPAEDPVSFLTVQADGESFQIQPQPEPPMPLDEGFTSTAQLKVTLDPGDPACAQGVDLSLTSLGLEPTVVRRDPPPYVDGQVIATEIVQMELGAFNGAVGQVLVRERADRASVGQIDNVLTSGGQLVSGHSSFDVFVQVELPDLGLTFTTGEVPVGLDGGVIQQLPPLGTAYQPVSPNPVPLVDADTQEEVGWLCHAEHVPVDSVPPYDPPPGTQDEDWFESTGQTTLNLSMAAFAPALQVLGQPLGLELMPMDVELSSEGLLPATVTLDPPPYEPGQVIHTEMTRLELGGLTFDGRQVVVRERADRRSRGSVVVHAVDADGNLVAGEASFDLFLNVEMPQDGTFLHTGMTPVHVTAGSVTGLPAIGAPYEHDPEDAQEVPLYDYFTFQQVGSIASGNHWPTEEVPCDECAVDLDIDSDNNNGVGPPDRSAFEDMIEEAPPGKYIGLNDDDDDGNNVRDLSEEPIRPNPPEDDPVFMVMEVSPNTPPDKWTLTYTPQVQVYDMDVVPPAIIPSGVTFPAPLTPNPKFVKVEGVQTSAALGDVVMTLTYECTTTDQYGYAQTQVLTDKVVATVIRVDLDVDSDNTNGTPDYGPQRDAGEDNIEDQNNQPGRYVLVNDDDDDNDQIADYGDGFNLDNIMSLDDVNAAENDFVRMVLEVPAPINLNQATLRFTYSASDPAAATAAGNPPTITPAAGQLRIWKRQGPGRNKGKAAVGGDYVHTGDVHPAGNLGLTNANRTVNLWIEGIRPSGANPERILVEVDPDGPGPAVWVARDAVRVRVVQLRFIDDANAAVVKTGPNGRLMISNVITDRLTDAAAAGSYPRAGVTFNGPPTGDADNFRAELLGTPAGANPQIRVDVVRPNNALRAGINYNTVAGAVGGANAHRTSQQIRLVTNGADDGVGGGAQDPTLLSSIAETLTNDTVRARATLGATTFETVLPVCRPPTEAQATAIRTAALHFVTLAGVMHNTGTTVNWMNEDWAQICIRYRSAGAVANQATVSNVLHITGPATGAGALTVTINTNAFNVPVADGDTAQQIATAVAAAINGVGGLTAAAFRHQGDYIVVVNRGTVVQPVFNVAPASTAPGVAFTQPTFTFDGTGDNAITLLEGAALGLNYKDNNNQTIDFFAVSANTVLGTAGATGYDGLAANLPGWENSIILSRRVLSPAAVNNTHLPGHEVGHSLFDIGNPGHSAVATNLFRAILTPEPNVNATKRLTDAQNTDARNDSGPGSAGPVLLQQN